MKGSEDQGQADIVLFLRRKAGLRVVWTPVMVLEIKTRSSFDFALYGLRPRTKIMNAFVPALCPWKVFSFRERVGEHRFVRTAAEQPATVGAL